MNQNWLRFQPNPGLFLVGQDWTSKKRALNIVVLCQPSLVTSNVTHKTPNLRGDYQKIIVTKKKNISRALIVKVWPISRFFSQKCVMKHMKKYREDFTQLKQNYQETPKKQFHTINPLQKVLE